MAKIGYEITAQGARRRFLLEREYSPEEAAAQVERANQEEQRKVSLEGRPMRPLNTVWFVAKEVDQ